ncbi:tetratricopeptide repeat-containing response regulator [Aliidiomarina soli]|uniref:Response regulator n=1 Tax=Aliidiomarina soli TaxID=1928574 RepID=A0A432WLP5_9GAMM|nr:tetratricopeptide repeat-containing response regulator [Aliidiomarina soli]RUO34678.1 response regulator [Aliidiomarina soli]
MSDSIQIADKKILIIDDQKPFQVMLKGLLSQLGARDVTAVGSGEAGIAAHNRDAYDILLVDYNLGRGKNGRQVLEEMKVRELLRPNGLFFIITGESTRPMVLSAIELQPDDYLMKPFSIGVLRSRLKRSFQKRHSLHRVYQTLFEKDYDACIDECIEHVDENGRYRNYCRQLLCELYLKKGQLNQAEETINELLREQRFSWGVLALAKIKYAQSDFNTSVELCHEVIRSTPNAVEAYDVLARSLQGDEQPVKALEAGRKAVTLAPFSITRQLYMSELARDGEQFELAKQAMQNVLDISRKSVYRNPRHLCNYIRSILDAAEQCESKLEINKYHQEASLALQRARSDESLFGGKLDYPQLENAVMARIEAFNGRYRQAQVHLNIVAKEFIENNAEINKDIAPDVAIAFLDIGEFERANTLIRKQKSDKQLDRYNIQMLDRRIKGKESQQQAYSEHNKKGISLYTEGDFGAAISEFEKALELAPMNSGVALNYIQAALKILGTSDEPLKYLVEGCKGCLRVLDGLTLPAKHKERLTTLKSEFESLQAQT